MATFVLLTRLISEEVKPSFTIGRKEEAVVETVHKACPQVKWIADYVTLGPYDYLDIFEAPDIETAMKVSSIIRSVAGAHTEVWPAIKWENHDQLMRDVVDSLDDEAVAA